MRIIQVMPEFGLAGAEIMCETLIGELRNLHNEVYAVSLFNYHSPITDRLENSGVKIFYLDKKSGLDVGIIKKLINIFREIKPDVVHTHRYVMKYVLPAAKIAKIRSIVHTVHNIAERENYRRDRVFYHIGYRLFGVTPVALSNEIRDSIVDVYHLSSNRIPVIFNGINLEKYKKKEDYSYDGEFRLLHIGRFAEQKNHEALLDAFYKVNFDFDFLKLFLIGEGELENTIKEKVHRLDLDSKIVFVGTTDRIDEYLHNSDLFVLPSKYEGMPMTLIEAMATGLPIVTTDVGGIGSMLTDQVDALLSKPVTNEIYKNLHRMILDEDLRRQCGNNAFRRACEFSSKTMAEKYMDVYKSMID